MIKESIPKLVEANDLSFEEAKAVMHDIMGGRATEAQIGSVLTSLRMKKETIDEITAFAAVMRERCARINPKVRGTLTDTCGTGGCKIKVVNVSTISAFVTAGAGVPVAKHGNRSNTAKCGSADLIEALGANLNLTPEQVEKVIEEVGIGFLFAPKFHPAMKYAVGPRREMGIRTVFNILGPLTNPAGAQTQIVGVFAEELVRQLTPVLHNLGVQSAMVVYGVDGLCEISTIGKTVVGEFRDRGEIRYYDMEPTDYGVDVTTPDTLTNVDPPESARIARDVLGGKKGPQRDIVILNSAAAIYVGGKANSIKEGVLIASDSVDSGKALKKLERFIEVTNEIGSAQ